MIELNLMPRIFTAAMQGDNSGITLQAEKKSLKNTVFCSEHLLLTGPCG